MSTPPVCFRIKEYGNCCLPFIDCLMVAGTHGSSWSFECTVRWNKTVPYGRRRQVGNFFPGIDMYILLIMSCRV